MPNTKESEKESKKWVSFHGQLQPSNVSLFFLFLNDKEAKLKPFFKDNCSKKFRIHPSFFERPFIYLFVFGVGYTKFITIYRIRILS